ncbi:MAG: hypothetical protein CM15mP42_12970 [Methanobacteriota archaeon]|nr:MAG: hypothetical protein CM15mP42_12970 [Euryarchaeota archaeon]
MNDKSVLVSTVYLVPGLKENLEALMSFDFKINKFTNILSVDVPSGFMTSTSVLPSQTVTFHDTKIGMNENNWGKKL